MSCMPWTWSAISTIALCVRTMHYICFVLCVCVRVCVLMEIYYDRFSNTYGSEAVKYRKYMRMRWRRSSSNMQCDVECYLRITICMKIYHSTHLCLLVFICMRWEASIQYYEIPPSLFRVILILLKNAQDQLFLGVLNCDQ